jgi:hypothetical protein
MENISHNNISLREELAIAYDEHLQVLHDRKVRKQERFERKVKGAYKNAKRIFVKKGWGANDWELERSNLPLAKAYREVLYIEDMKEQEMAYDNLRELKSQIAQSCEYVRAHTDDRANLCGLRGLLDMYSDVHKDAYGFRSSGWYLIPDDIYELLETVTDEELDRFWELLNKNGVVAPYEI